MKNTGMNFRHLYYFWVVAKEGGMARAAARSDVKHVVWSTLEDVRSMLSSSNANRAKGHLTAGDKTWEIYANDQLLKASDYRDLIVTYRNGAAVQLATQFCAEAGAAALSFGGSAATVFSATVSAAKPALSLS